MNGGMRAQPIQNPCRRPTETPIPRQKTMVAYIFQLLSVIIPLLYRRLSRKQSQQKGQCYRRSVCTKVYRKPLPVHSCLKKQVRYILREQQAAIRQEEEKYEHHHKRNEHGIPCQKLAYSQTPVLTRRRWKQSQRSQIRMQTQFSKQTASSPPRF